jgi:Spy/CpxP family protein refolding chaperone
MNPTQTSRSKAIAGALLALTFLAGAAAGVVADRWLGTTPMLGTKIVRDMSGVLDKLELSADQRVRAEAIFQRSRPGTAAAMKSVSDRLKAVADSVDAELRAILTPEQRVRLDSLKRSPVMVLKRMTPGSTTVDTVFPGKRP